LSRIHQQQTELEARLAAPALYQSDGKDQLKALLLEKAELDARCTAQEAVWLKLAEELEALESA
jgi:ATP-binding cassette subfamily F protein 3